MHGDGEIKARAAAGIAVLTLVGGSVVTLLPSGEAGRCVGRPCWTDQGARDQPVPWNSHLDLEHQPPVASGGIYGGGTAVDGPPLRLRWNVEGAA